MSTWSKNNKAHSAAFLIAYYIYTKRKPNKKDDTFECAKKWPNSEIINAIAGDSSAILKDKADKTAVQIDELFGAFFAAKYESGNTKAGSISAMAAYLSQTEAMYSGIGEIVDVNYLFAGELQ